MESALGKGHRIRYCVPWIIMALDGPYFPDTNGLSFISGIASLVTYILPYDRQD